MCILYRSILYCTLLLLCACVLCTVQIMCNIIENVILLLDFKRSVLTFQIMLKL